MERKNEPISRDVEPLQIKELKESEPTGVPPLPTSVQVLVDMMPWYCGQIVYCKTFPGQDPIYAKLEEGLLAERVIAAAEVCLRVAPSLYRHQASGIRAALLGHDVIVATPTASGAYN
jgi:ATP-dependent helicase YprA (DUF1998 family)